MKFQWSAHALATLPQLQAEGKTTLPMPVIITRVFLDVGANLSNLKDNDVVAELDFGPKTDAEMDEIMAPFKKQKSNGHGP